MNRIKSLKDIGLGKRVFLVGNVSLNDMNLDLLENEYSINESYYYCIQKQSETYSLCIYFF